MKPSPSIPCVVIGLLLAESYFGACVVISCNNGSAEVLEFDVECLGLIEPLPYVH